MRKLRIAEVHNDKTTADGKHYREILSFSFSVFPAKLLNYPAKYYRYSFHLQWLSFCEKRNSFLFAKGGIKKQT